MKISKLHTFEEVLTRGITMDDAPDPVRISCIFIPKIQRSYAQGRKSEADIRSDFLKDLFSTLTSQADENLELGFLLGSKQSLVSGKDDCFELLDGQQRATTLYLLHWYIHCRESAKMPDFLSHFTYETRDTSRQFLDKIALAKMPFDDKPSKVIRRNKWFTDDFYCDATITSMLNMLDDIHDKYREAARTNLLSRLDKIKFYVLLLEKFDMSDELYIKMNSRGLSLIPFENFKASLVKYMKSPDRKGIYGTDVAKTEVMPFWLRFASNIDARWIDIIWKNPFPQGGKEIVSDIIDIDDKSIGDKFFRFFNRYFFTKAALFSGIKNKQPSPLTSFFFSDTNKNEDEQRLRGWENYEELFELIQGDPKPKQFPVFGDLAKVLDVFHRHMDTIYSVVKQDPFSNTKDFDVFGDNFTLAHRAAFAAITEFIEAVPDNMSFGSVDVQENFRRMFRVVHNMIENTPIEGTIPLVNIIGAFKEIISLPGAADQNFYKSLAQNAISSRNRQLSEELEKAGIMFDSNGNYLASWEKEFISAEHHPFFKGSVLFFFSSSMADSSEFRKRFTEVSDMFDAKGITSHYRQDHILIRALLSCLNHWDSSGMSGRYFTENAEKEKYLKNILIGCPEVRDMFCNYFDNPQGDFESYLNTVIANASCRNSGNSSFNMLYERLIKNQHSPAVFDWISKREKEKKACFRIQENRSYIVAIPGKWHDQLVLDTERHLIIPEFINQGFHFSDPNQEKAFQSMGDSWGWRIGIEKDFTANNTTYRIMLSFNEWKWVDFYVKVKSQDKDNTSIAAAFQKSSDSIEYEGVKAGSIPYQFLKDKGSIEKELQRIETTISSI